MPGPIEQTPPPPAKAFEDMATTLSLDLLLPPPLTPLLDKDEDALEEEEELAMAPLLLVDEYELDEEELDADLGSDEANLNIVSHSSSHSFSVRMRPYCIF